MPIGHLSVGLLSVWRMAVGLLSVWRLAVGLLAVLLMASSFAIGYMLAVPLLAVLGLVLSLTGLGRVLLDRFVLRGGHVAGGLGLRPATRVLGGSFVVRLVLLCHRSSGGGLAAACAAILGCGTPPVL